MTQLIDDIRASRDEMAKRGRCTGFTQGDKGNVCAVGAIFAAVAPQFLGTPAWNVMHSSRAKAVVDELLQYVPEHYHDLWIGEYALAAYNDTRGVTDEDLFNLFDKALANLGGLAQAGD